MKVAKEFIFHAAHRDTEAPEGDQCGRLHGHTYKLCVEVEAAECDVRGMVVHGDVLKAIYRLRIEPFVEHRNLCDTLGSIWGDEEAAHNPTMENVLYAIASVFEEALSTGMGDRFKAVTVRLWETPTMYAEITL